ncbi:hypothetical protein N0V90_002913 [Kalmusia sp. IMI 367209]|nr:hypothetical protein N0V90_002913 [Kalmusia sp. IMI 367209]
MATSYELIYYVGVPGRGEHIRLLLEESDVQYTDTAALTMDECRSIVTKTLDGDRENPPYYAPPLFRHNGLLISQTSNVLMYLGRQLGLAGQREDDVWRVNALALSALDGLSNEVHDCHHPIGIELYYEDQRKESARRSKEWIKTRLPKHLGYWEKVLKSETGSKGPWLLGDIFTYADIVLFQLCEDIKTRPKLAAYLASERRQKYDWGIYRYYPENDVKAE